MKRNIAPRLILLLVLFCSGAYTLAQDVSYNYDRDVDFAGYKTYQWAEPRAGVANPLRDKDIRRAIEAQLAQKGLQKVESNADLAIQYQTGVDRERQLDAWTMGPRWSGMARANTSTIEVGTLVLNLYDREKKQLVWRGSVSKTLNVNRDPDKNYKNLEKAVAKLLKNYPPKSER